MRKIGFIGLGNMGYYMSKNLSKAGLIVTGYDINQKIFDKNKDFNIKQAHSLEELYEGNDCVISMLPNGEIVNEVWKELIVNISKHTLLIDCSTIDIKTSKYLHETAKINKISSLDAPVSGGTIGAENQTLTFMVGGNNKTYELALPIFNKMGNKSIYCGGYGSGQAVKMCNNLLLASTMSSLGEVIEIAQKLRLNKQKLFDVLSTSTGSCWALNNYCPIKGVGPSSPADNDFKPGFSSNLMLKDLKIALEASKGLKLDLAEVVIEKYKQAIKDGKGHLDFSSIVN